MDLYGRLVSTTYFDQPGISGQAMMWAVATRLKLERWEELVAVHARRRWGEAPPDGGVAVMLEMRLERHFCLIAAAHLLRALKMMDPPLAVDPILSEALIAGRDLHEHWHQNMPVFNSWPQVSRAPRSSGRRFADRNPDRSPYGFWSWSSKAGAILLPDVTAMDLHALLDQAQERALPDLPKTYAIPPRRQSSWMQSPDGAWWPNPSSPNSYCNPARD